MSLPYHVLSLVHLLLQYLMRAVSPFNQELIVRGLRERLRTLSKMLVHTLRLVFIYSWIYAASTFVLYIPIVTNGTERSLRYYYVHDSLPYTRAYRWFYSYLLYAECSIDA